MIAASIVNGSTMEVDKISEKNKRIYDGKYELKIVDTLAILYKYEGSISSIPKENRNLYYEIDDEIYYVKMFRNGKEV